MGRSTCFLLFSAVLDDGEARQVAAERHLRITGTLGVLELAATQGMIDLATCIAQSRATNFRITEKTVQEILQRSAR